MGLSIIPENDGNYRMALRVHFRLNVPSHLALHSGFDETNLNSPTGGVSPSRSEIKPVIQCYQPNKTSVTHSLNYGSAVRQLNPRQVLENSLSIVLFTFQIGLNLVIVFYRLEIQLW